jgi:F420-dependent oxidoreductase-like protein
MRAAAASASGRRFPERQEVDVELCLMIEGQEGVTWEQWRAIARACEEHGVRTLFRSDHYLSLMDDTGGWGSLDAWATIAGLAAITDTLRLGTLVSPATFRHPSELARVAATADHISGGRIELGLGAGWHEPEHRAHGFSFPELRTRMEILDEQLQIVLRSWTDGPFSFRGAHYTLEDLDARPKPVQRPHPPLIMGGSAGPRGSALAARYADEYNVLTTSIDEIRELKGRITAACERAGRDPISISVMAPIVVGRDADDLRARVERVARMAGEEPDALLSGSSDGWLVGLVEDVAERLGAWREEGVSRVMFQHLAHEDLAFIGLVGEVLAPRLA